MLGRVLYRYTLFFVPTLETLGIPMKVASVRVMREIETAANRSIMSYEQMMLNAGAAASACMQARFPITEATNITFLIGKGNNGGDGLVMATDLAQTTAADIQLYLLEQRDTGDINYQAALSCGLAVTLAEDDSDRTRLADLINSADVVVDALFGIGLRLPVEGEAANVLESLNRSLRSAASKSDTVEALDPAATGPSATPRRPFILSIDCPSGIDCDTGQTDPETIAADATITFIAAKPGLLTFPAAAHAGELVISSIGIPHDLPELERITDSVVDRKLAASLLPFRPIDGHKGTFGKVLVTAGSPKYIGAIALAGESAYRSGAGLVTIATSRQLIDTIAGVLREPTWLPLPDLDGAIAESASEIISEHADGFDAMLLGCGLGLTNCTRRFVESLLTNNALPPLILDADALNILSQLPHWWEILPADTIITPHPGEMARLTGMTAREISADRWTTSRRCAEAWSVVIVLKGAHTLIAAPDGRTSVIPIKTDALATAGTGDVLAGLIAGLRAQGPKAYDSARLGAYIHAAAGIRAAETVGSSRSVIAGDVLSALGSAFETLEAF